MFIFKKKNEGLLFYFYKLIFNVTFKVTASLISIVQQPLSAKRANQNTLMPRNPI